ncbi:MAG: RimK family alpha-L-glutamate ligase [Pseudomonadota bacterium]
MSLHDRRLARSGGGGAGAGLLGPGIARAVWILQRRSAGRDPLANPNTARLAESLLARGIPAAPVDPEGVDQTRGPAALRIAGRPVAPPCAIIGRSGANTGARARALSAMLEATGTLAFPSARALAVAGDKLATGRLLAASGLPSPDFAEIGPGTDAHALGAQLGWPLVVKAARGSKGRAVRLVDGPAALAAAMAALLGQGPLLAQRFLAESRGRDIRVMVVGGTAIGAMAREVPREVRGPDPYRANIAAGAHGRAIALAPAIARLAEEAARAAALDIAGVDLLHAGSGFAVCELNAAPGFAAFEAVTGIDVAGAIAGHIATRLAARREGAEPC